MLSSWAAALYCCFNHHTLLIILKINLKKEFILEIISRPCGTKETFAKRKTAKILSRFCCFQDEGGESTFIIAKNIDFTFDVCSPSPLLLR